MRFQFSLPVSLAVVAALALSSATRSQAQSTPPLTPGNGTNGTYSAIDPLANVRYDNRFDVSLGAAYAHIKAGPPPLHEGANLGGLDLSASYWFSRHWALEGTGRGYAGTSGAGLGPGNTEPHLIQGPFVSQYLFAAGPEWLGPHNKHGALFAHALIGGAYGDFERDLGPLKGNLPPGVTPAEAVEFFPNQFAPAAIIGGHIDLNRTPQWVFRITPDAIYTRYNINYGNMATYGYWNFGISAGVQYKFKTKR
jgi:hypothetical protein